MFFCSTSTFVYLKLISIWVSCIAFDLLVGCRLELGWPIVLFVRHFNEIMNAPNGPLRFYSVSFYIYANMQIYKGYCNGNILKKRQIL